MYLKIVVCKERTELRVFILLMISADMFVTFNYVIAWFSEYFSAFTVQLEQNLSLLPQTPYASWEKALLSSVLVQRCHYLSSAE